ncbi:ABC transporter [Corynebacterium liangguodongii]|uniref:ABC transporter n=1 Tax=Corynebacterium liangguodongii TaxID=2079535 RepID=A0A2S0WGZ0_9CORY|nr:ABC transporter [Corynebacterium liangguodongii]PWB98660.1 ABC transporter family substrate-binding protein [Corynebacterium liangguodongii]
MAYRRVGLALAAAAALAAAGCAARPGPPPLVQQGEEYPGEAEPTTTTTPAPPRPQRTQVQVASQPLRAGLNPHLLADESALVSAIADLTLPSAFSGGERNSDLLAGATVLPSSPGAMTVRYVITGEAQWSDGTPITGADFVYLWRAMKSTPGVIDPAGYRAISDIRVSGPLGKTVDVNFSAPVGDWRGLFAHLMPSHLLEPDASDFATAAAETLPASAGRFMVHGVDRARGTITLNRNDRFWGRGTAAVDVVSIVASRSTAQTTDRLRSGQVAFVDMIPDQTTREAFSLLPGTQVRMVDGPRTLGVSVSVTSPIVGDIEAREALSSLIDVPLVARLAAGRDADLSVAAYDNTASPNPGVLTQRATPSRPLRIAADAADPEATAAARSIVDLAVRRGVPAKVVSTDALSIVSGGLASDSIDAVVHYVPGTQAPNELASRLYCQPADYRAGNLTGLCTPHTEELADAILAGRIAPAQARAAVEEALGRERVWIPLLYERRIQALGQGIVGPDPDVANWPGGLDTAASWRLAEGYAEASGKQ